ncbi:unnamed protein product [Lactuca virosa]|uniref:Uncharacterized protein n=1 Tax=Lactuca virosa TaxID=75947 RepID=A0AAU9NAS2_9ASTR|nr:unnamed protein product [Lactuca virosa]
MNSLDEYCQKLKDLADQLTDVENPVSEKRLVLQMVRGLPPEYDTAAAFINQTLPDWDTAHNMLQLEHNRQQARESQSVTGLAATVTEANTVSDQPSRPPPRPSRGPPSNRQQQRGPNRREHPHPGNQSQPRAIASSSSVPAGQYTHPPWWAMMPPPCPYPTQQGWAYP